MRVHRVVGFVCILLLSGAFCFADEATPAKSQRTTWFKNAKWGVFTHYMADTVGADASPEAWNQAVNSFDAQNLAEQLKTVGASYYIITLGQNSGYYCSPNATYDKYVGITPSKCSSRDLVSDLADALRARGIALMVYLPSGAPDRDSEAMAALEWKKGGEPEGAEQGAKEGVNDPRLKNFQQKWEEIIREWSTRWGTKVAGWWFDGCYFADAMYRFPDAPNFDSFAAAARAGNPNAIVAFNPGVKDPVETMTPAEDYTAGEINDPDKVKCPGRWVGGAQFHMLSYLGPSWAQVPPRFTNDQVISITESIARKGGVVSWDVPIEATGLISQPFLEQLAALGAAMKRDLKRGAASGNINGSPSGIEGTGVHVNGRVSWSGRIENRIEPKQRPYQPGGPRRR
jgi:alpha-L-fucosidase